MRGLFFAIGMILIILSSSCVPHKEIVYYQDKGNTNDSIPILVEQPKPYRLQINDIISIVVKALDQENVAIFNPVGDAQLTATAQERGYFDGFTVDDHGNIRVPTLGYINVLGFTTEEVRELIETRLLEEQFKETAKIFVTVKLAGLRYTASGELNGTGSQVVFQERVNLHEAVANVGGVTEFGDATDVMIIRQYPTGQKIYHLDLTDLAVANSPYYYIQPNDMIYVKPRKQKALGIGTTGFETLTTVVSIFSLLTTVYLLITR